MNQHLRALSAICLCVALLSPMTSQQANAARERDCMVPAIQELTSHWLRPMDSETVAAVENAFMDPAIPDTERSNRAFEALMKWRLGPIPADKRKLVEELIRDRTRIVVLDDTEPYFASVFQHWMDRLLVSIPKRYHGSVIELVCRLHETEHAIQSVYAQDFGQEYFRYNMIGPTANTQYAMESGAMTSELLAVKSVPPTARKKILKELNEDQVIDSDISTILITLFESKVEHPDDLQRSVKTQLKLRGYSYPRLVFLEAMENHGLIIARTVLAATSAVSVWGGIRGACSYLGHHPEQRLPTFRRYFCSAHLTTPSPKPSP